MEKVNRREQLHSRPPATNNGKDDSHTNDNAVFKVKKAFSWVWNSLILPYWNWRKKRKELYHEKRRAKGFVRDWIETIVSVLIMVFIIRVAVVEAYRIPTPSMEKTLLVGDFLLVNKFIYGIRTPDWIGIPFTKIGFSIPFTRLPGFIKPKQGDVIVFKYPRDERINYIKRCVAVSGQTVEIRNKKLFIDGKPFDEPPDMQHVESMMLPPQLQQRDIYPRGAGNRDNYGPVQVPEGHYFMMGDNRDNSQDSRYWGFMPERNIVGKALVIYFSWNKTIPLYQLEKLHKKIRWNRILDPIK